MKKPSPGCMSAMLTALVVAGGAYWKLSTPPTISAVRPKAEVTVVERKEREVASNRLSTSIDEITEAAKRSEHKPFALEATETQLTDLVGEKLRETHRSDISNVVVGVDPQHVSVQGDVEFKGHTFKVTLIGGVTVVDNHLNYTVDSLLVGGAPAPPSLRSKVEKDLSEGLNKALLKAPGQLSRVTLGQGKVNIEGVTR